MTSICTELTYVLYATFDNVDGLKARSPVSIGGVVVGQAMDITLDSKTYLPHVALETEQRYSHIPDTSSLSTRTSSLLGEQHLALSVDFKDPEPGTIILKDGDTIQNTKSAIVLEDLTGRFLYGSKSGDNENSGGTPAAAPGNNETTEPMGTAK